MDEKKFDSPRKGSPKPGYLDHQQTLPRTSSILSRGRSRLFSRWILVLTALVVIAITCHNYLSFSQQAQTRLINLKHSGPLARPNKRVPLEAHIISKCPDTRDALRLLILPVMQRVSDKVDFKLNYIGTPTDNDGVQCKHGPQECMGNIIELCARELYPDPKLNLGFIMCLSKDFAQIPDRTLVEDCALEHAINFKALEACAARDDGAHGLAMLRESVNRTAEAKVTISCTIRLDEKVYCIRDGGHWKDCPSGGGVNELVDAIEHSYHQRA